MKDKFKETLTNILSYLLKVERRTLLWENTSPTTSFSPQTITLDVSNYDAFEVEFKHWSNDDTRVTARAENDAYNHVALCPTYTSTAMSKRLFSANVGTGIWFGVGYGSNNSQDNSGAIPTKIYGIKFGGGTA